MACKLLILNREKMDRLEQRDSLGTILYNFWPRYLTLVISASPMSLLILPPAALPLSNPRIRRWAFPACKFHDAITNERQDERRTPEL
jgi:hypothetical protein